MYKIAVYGKGGIGKSTTTANIAAALAKTGLTVFQIGCDPKADSTMLHMNGKRMKTVLDVLRKKGKAEANDIIKKGTDGVWCAECGGPVPGTGCAGRGIITAFEEFKKLKAIENIAPDVLLYDVPGDVVCGGFAMPLRGGYAKNVFVVSSGEKMSIYAAANIAIALESFKGRNYAELSGVILNRRGVAREREIAEEFAQDANTKLVGDMPREALIQEAEDMNKTLVEAFPESEAAKRYLELAEAVLAASTEV